MYGPKQSWSTPLTTRRKSILTRRSTEHSPCVSVLISDLLLHLCVCQGLQQGAPLVSITCVSNGYLHCGQGVLAAKHQRQQQKHFSLCGFTLLQLHVQLVIFFFLSRVSGRMFSHLCETWSHFFPLEA